MVVAVAASSVETAADLSTTSWERSSEISKSADALSSNYSERSSEIAKSAASALAFSVETAASLSTTSFVVFVKINNLGQLNLDVRTINLSRGIPLPSQNRKD